MRFLLILFMFFNQQFIQAQNFTGFVLSSETKLPVAFASVYLSNTSIGTTTNDKGEFTIQNFPNGRYDLVVSSMGFETYQTIVQSNQLAPITIYLKTRAKELDEVVVQSYEKDGWNKWGKLFVESFIGTSAFAQNCTIKNYKAIRFRFNKKENTLVAFANETLLIENKDLGYLIKYDLIDFTYHFRSSLLFYSGYPLFIPMDATTKRKQMRWEKNRNEAYKGSIMHFMRALYRNTFEEENFELRRLYKIPNTEKVRVKNIMTTNFKKANLNNDGALKLQVTGNAIQLNSNEDSTEYYNRILREPDEKNILVNQLLSGDSIAYAHDKTTAALDFENYIQVLYKGKSEPYEYAQYKKYSSAASNLTSIIHLVNKQPVYVFANGMYYNGNDLLCSEYWAWSEKLATLLPFDFKPTKN